MRSLLCNNLNSLSCTLCYGSVRACDRFRLGRCRVGGHRSLAPHHARAAECLTQPAGCVLHHYYQAVCIAQGRCVFKHKTCGRLQSLRCCFACRRCFHLTPGIHQGIRYVCINLSLYQNFRSRDSDTTHILSHSVVTRSSTCQADDGKLVKRIERSRIDVKKLMKTRTLPSSLCSAMWRRCTSSVATQVPSGCEAWTSSRCASTRPCTVARHKLMQCSAVSHVPPVALYRATFSAEPVHHSLCNLSGQATCCGHHCSPSLYAIRVQGSVFSLHPMSLCFLSGSSLLM